MAKRTREEWRREVREWRRSGLTAREFAATRELSASTLAWWAWRLGGTRDAPTKGRARAQERAALQLLPLRVEGERADVSGTACVRWEIETPDGCVLRVFVDGPDLTRLIERMLDSAGRRS